MAVGLGFTLPDVTRITTAVAEVARNIARFAWSGVVVLKAEHRDGAPAIVVEAIDGGPGMPDVEMGTAHEFGTGAGSGLGLSTARRLMDYLSIASQAGVGTTVTMRKDA
jgi:serine/threonine-protein kinase RsbT